MYIFLARQGLCSDLFKGSAASRHHNPRRCDGERTRVSANLRHQRTHAGQRNLPARIVLTCKICVWSLRGQGLMRWVRANRRAVACCALFALAVQLILSFGHFHLTVGLGSGSSSLASSFGDQARPQPGDTDGGPSKPAVPVADYCGICAVINLAAWLIAETSATPSPQIDARARAPPAV